MSKLLARDRAQFNNLTLEKRAYLLSRHARFLGVCLNLNGESVFFHATKETKDIIELWYSRPKMKIVDIIMVDYDQLDLLAEHIELSDLRF